MPALAAGRGWPVRFDHCFQRILLDNAAGGPWREQVAPPAWRNASDALLARAVALGEGAVAGSVDLAALNQASLRWRGRLRPVHPARGG
ncbi:GCN5-related N-acetyltransferase [Qipengyuania thermophila]|uniref:GCN5-related N-acetyltransferase n=1 Tax=Qipengyuania thermophila TaxID=2509361 RepID=UPI001F3AA3BF|nr:GCN5-related N-acetyltransferase [Qipengyuania thermophila]